VPARLKLVHNGRVIHTATGTNLTFEIGDFGAYRVEAWLAVAGEERPWIYSNPIRLRAPTLADMRLPSNELAGHAEVTRDLAYVEGKAEDEAKHRLDVYRPKGATNAPVFFFVHGGAWKYGDRNQYTPLGNRYTREGFVTVVPSYRLAPKNPFPAQIEDVAAAFAWTLRRIGEWGGDTNRLCVGGHSAGGHLAALLALDRSRLEPLGVSPASIRSVLALSGVYDLTDLDAVTKVFSNDPADRRAASPLTHVRPDAPPFLVTYCQWDYFSLPAQARRFHAALGKAGVPSALVYVPGQNHISEMLNVGAADDPTVAAAVGFMRGR
jgi:acetyl esterase/lipase